MVGGRGGRAWARSGLVAAAIAVALGAAPARGQGDDGSDPDVAEIVVNLGPPAEGETDEAALEAARPEAVRFLLESPRTAAALLAVGRHRDAVRAALLPVVKPGRIRATRGGSGRRMATFTASRAAALAAALDVVRPEERWAKDPVLVVAADPDMPQPERAAAAAAATETLQRFRFRIAGEGDRTTAALVLAVQGKVYAEERGGGHVELIPSVRARLYHKPTDTVLALVTVEVVRVPGEGVAPGRVGSARAVGASAARERVALAGRAAEAAVLGVVKKLAQEDAQGAPGGPAPPAARDHYEVRLSGLPDEASELLQAALTKAEGFEGWREGGSFDRAGVKLVVLRCTYQGPDAKAAVEAAAAAAGVEVEVARDGNAITVRAKK